MSRQNNSMPWDLLAAALISILALAATLLPPDLVRLTAPIGIVLVFFLPGYAATIAIFPRARDTAIKDRLLLSLGLSIAIAILSAFGLSTNGELDPASFAQAIAIIALIAIAAALVRWFSLPKGWRFIPSYKKDIGINGRRKKPGMQRGTGVVLFAVAAIAVLSALAYINTSNTTIAATSDKANDKGFTEFYVVDDSSPVTAQAGGSSSLIVGIINREHHAADYTLRFSLNGSALSEKRIKLNQNKSWEGPVSFVVKNPGYMQKLDLVLYKDGDFSKPYEEKQVWINVLEQSTQSGAANTGTSAAKNENLSASNLENGGESNSGGSFGTSLQNENAMGESTSIQNPEESPVEENNAEVQEAQSPEAVANPPTPEEPEQKEQPSSGTNEVHSNVSQEAEENGSSGTSGINISSENITLNVTEGISVVNASDIDQEIGEGKAEGGGAASREVNASNNSTGNISTGNISTGNISANNNTNRTMGSSLKGDQNWSPEIGINITKPANLKFEMPKHNFTTNGSMYNAPQIFYTRPKPGSSNPKESAPLETSPTKTTNGQEKNNSGTKSASDNNSVYKIQSTANVSAKEPAVSKVNPEGPPKAVLNKSNQSITISNETSSGTSQKVNASNSANTSKSATTADKSLNATKTASLKTQPTTPQDEEALRMKQMDSKIDSWVNSRIPGSENASQSYKSDIIQYNGKGNSVVLGGRSQAPMKVG